MDPGAALVMVGIPCHRLAFHQKGVGLLLVASCFSNRDKQLPGSYADFNFPLLASFVVIWPLGPVQIDVNKNHCTAVARNRPTEALISVISFTFVVYSHYKHS